MNISPIHTDADYRAALQAISRLVETDPAPGTAEGDFLDVMGTLIEAYEQTAFPIEAAGSPRDPVQPKADSAPG